MDTVMKVKAKELYKALKEIEHLKEFETIYFVFDEDYFSLFVVLKWSDKEGYAIDWYSGDDYEAIKSPNCNNSLKSFITPNKIPYLMSFVETALKKNRTIKIKFTDNSVEFRTLKIALVIERS